jgi:hypothetical protein
MLCSYRCGQEAIKQFKNGNLCCSESQNSCPEMRKQQSEKARSRTKDNNEGRRIQAEIIRGRTKKTHDGVRRMSETLTGRTKENNKSVRRTADKLNGRTKETHEYIRIRAEKHSEWMKNGGASYLNSFNKNPSKQQVEIWKMVTKICPYVYLNLPVNHLERQANIDVAVPKLEIAIEYNEPAYHGEWQGSKENDDKRQKMLEEEGWKVLNYYPLPTLEQLKEDIQNLLI